MRHRLLATCIVVLAILACGGGGAPSQGAASGPMVGEEKTLAGAEKSAPKDAGRPETIPTEGTHCGDDEVAWFSCAVAGGKTVSICSDWPLSPKAGRVFYRFGPLGSPELVYPSAPTHYTNDFSYRFRQDMGGQTRLPSAIATLSFTNEDVSYTVHHDVALNNAEIHVDRGSRRLATLPCTKTNGELSWLFYRVGWDDGLPM